MEDVRRLPIGENDQTAVTLDDLAREGAGRMIATALEAEVADYVERFAEQRDDDGKRSVVRNGRARERKITIGSGTLPIQAPRVNDKRVDDQTGQRQRFSSKILPAYARRSPKVNDVLPVLYVRGLSTGDFRPALEQLLGEDAAGLSPSTISRLAKTGRPSTNASAPARCASTSTPTGSSTASTCRCDWARTTGCACWS